MSRAGERETRARSGVGIAAAPGVAAGGGLLGDRGARERGRVVARGLRCGVAVEQLALRKARAIGDRYRETPVLGADTEVVLDSVPLGKPGSRPAAARMIGQLAGRTHTVFTGVALTCRGEAWSGVAASKVRFRALEGHMIERYLDRAQYADKAGAYGIQEDGGELVESYTGRLDTIVGLPLDVVESLWQRMVRAEE